MKLLKLGVFVLSGMTTLAAQAEVPLQLEPQVGVYLTQHFGGASAVPAEFGMKFHYGDARENIYQRTSIHYRPAMLDLRFNRDGITALNVSGVNTLMPSYVLRQEAEEGGGILDNINWGLVGMAALGAGIYYASENYRDDREDDRAEAEQRRRAAAGGGEQAGEEGGGGTCLPGDPTGMLCLP